MQWCHRLSVMRIDGTGLYVALYQWQLYDAAGKINDLRVVFRVASKPEGPWSDPVTIADRDYRRNELRLAIFPASFITAAP